MRRLASSTRDLVVALDVLAASGDRAGMRYYVSLDPAATQEPTVVDVTELPTGSLEVSLDGKTVPVDIVWLDGTASIRVDGRVVDLTVEGQPPEIGAIASGHRSYVRVESER
ncbi:MAG TPA: hypothetical protein VM580_02075, partial [Labilithrix sp.]|nr:hypothetical protein [Labilithrix sp.]